MILLQMVAYSMAVSLQEVLRSRWTTTPVTVCRIGTVPAVLPSM